MPKTNYGKWSVLSLLAMFALFAISSYLANHIYELEPDGDTIYTYFISRSILEILMRGGFAAGISALINGLISIFNLKERAVLIYISTIFGAAATLFFIVEFLFTH